MSESQASQSVCESQASQTSSVAASATRLPPRRWTEAETSLFLSLMKGDGLSLGYHQKIKTEKLPRKGAMKEVAAALREKGLEGLHYKHVDNKWKSMLKRYRAVEDHNSKSGNDTMKEDWWHSEMAEIMGDRASTRPHTLLGSGLPVPGELRRGEDDSRSTSPSPIPEGESEDDELLAGPSSPGHLDSDKSRPRPDSLGRRRSGAGSEEGPRPASVSTTAPAEKRRSSEYSLTEGKKKQKKAESRSRASDIWLWADDYEKRRSKEQEEKMVFAKEQHREKMDLLGRLCSALEKQD